MKRRYNIRIIREVLETCISEINNLYAIHVSVKYFNGRTHLYIDGRNLCTGTTLQCFESLSTFMTGFHIGRQIEIKSEVK